MRAQQETMDEISSEESSTKTTFSQRHIKRRRKQEMVDLYASLLAHVPQEYRKGDKHISHHTQEAADYITDMKNSIKELRGRKEKLKGLSTNSGNSTSSSPNIVTVKPCRPDGVEILINSSFEEGGGFPLSKILKELLERRFDVVSCVSTVANERSLHNIICEANDPDYNDLLVLQERLDNMINPGSNTC